MSRYFGQNDQKCVNIAKSTFLRQNSERHGGGGVGGGGQPIIRVVGGGIRENTSEKIQSFGLVFH